MQLISEFNKGFQFELCVIGIFRKNIWVVPLKDNKVITITEAIQTFLNESSCKPNKIWVDKENEFYNRSMKSCLRNNDIEIYSTHN